MEGEDGERNAIKALALGRIAEYMAEVGRQATQDEMRAAVMLSKRDVEHHQMLGMTPVQAAAMEWGFAMEGA